MSKKKKIIVATIIIVAVALVSAAIGAGVVALILSNKGETESANEIAENTAINENNTSNNSKDNTSEDKKNTVNKNNTTNNTNNNTTNNSAKNTTNNTSKNTNTSTSSKATEKATPYVKKNNLKVGSAKENYSNPIYFYTTDKTEDRNVIDVGAKFDNNSASYKFYDYSVSAPDKNGNVEISFKYDVVIPLRYTREDYSYKEAYYYNTYGSYPKLFDYYTGEIYKTNTSSNDTSLKDNEIVYDGKTIKVGVRNVSTSTWDGNNKESDNVYSDTRRITHTYTISVPKDYDGLMIGFLKKGANKESFDNYKEYIKKYNELKKQAEETGKKSTELIKIETREKSMLKILENSIYDKKIHTKDEFYVFKVKDITPLKK